MAANKIPTNPQLIRVFLRGGIVAEGQAHVKAGAYRQRVSDLLNLQAAPFLALTDVKYQAPGAPPTHTEAFLVSIPDIVAVDLSGSSDGSEPEADERDADESASDSSTTSTTPAPPPPPGSSI